MVGNAIQLHQAKHLFAWKCHCFTVWFLLLQWEKQLTYVQERTSFLVTRHPLAAYHLNVLPFYAPLTNPESELSEIQE